MSNSEFLNKLRIPVAAFAVGLTGLACKLGPSIEYVEKNPEVGQFMLAKCLTPPVLFLVGAGALVIGAIFAYLDNR